MNWKRIDEKVTMIFANFFGASPFTIDIEQNIDMQFEADYVDAKELMWIINEEFSTYVNETDIKSVNSTVRAIKNQSKKGVKRK